MRHKTVFTSNVIRLLSGLDALQNRDLDEEGMGLLYGRSGEGKTTAIAFAANQRDAYYVRARATWTPRPMLRSISEELGLVQGAQVDPMLQAVANKLSVSPAPLFIDEADYLVSEVKLLDIARDVYDISQVPIMLILSKTSVRKLMSGKRFERHRRRISQRVCFEGISLEDADKVSSQLAEIDISKELVARIFEKSQGNIGAFTRGLRNVERFARANELETMSLNTWGERPLPSPGPERLQPLKK